MSRLKDIREGFENLVSETAISSGKTKRKILEDVSDVIEESLREHDGIEFGGQNWGLVCKLVVLDDMLLYLDD
jgi:hypothetical protein|tara:strand:- start:195 stop:413 length:219 start_codon:yes stop_codon:yes gene_type:complete